MNGEAIKISIIVPIYNVEDYVKPCIESLIGQSYRNLEIILVDDGSTDHCPEICDIYAKKDKRIRVIHKPNGGVVSARKAGVAAATGDYVLNVDGDDWIEKDRVEALVKDGIGPSHADMIYLSGFIREFGDKSVPWGVDVPIELFENSEIENKAFPLLMASEDDIFDIKVSRGLTSWAVRRELLLKNQMLVDDRVTYGEDSLCLVFCLLDAKSVMMIQQGGYHYIQRASSTVHQMISSYGKNLLPIKIWYQVLKNQLEQKHAPEKILKICGHNVISFIMAFDYNFLLHKFPDYLFPFPKVYSGARIVVYGAGKFGCRLVQGLDKTKKCSIVLWVDQNQNLPAVPGYIISSRDAISSVDYDFIVVAIMKAAVSTEVKNSLIANGVPEEKIATMDFGVISENAVPDEVRDFYLPPV